MTGAGGTRFEVVRRLGKGGMGVVYEARDRETGGRVALKTLIELEPETLLLFKNEFRALQDLHHRNLVRFGELVEDQGQWFFTMELVDGVDFLTYVRGRAGLALGTPPTSLTDSASAETAAAMAIDDTLDGSDASLPTIAAATGTGTGTGANAARRPVTVRAGAGAYDERRLRESFAQLARGLNELHDAGKIHRDVKPSNVMVTPEGRVVLLDFGVVADLAQRRAVDDGIVGTMAYMAPEQARAGTPGPPADWYSAGVVLFEALTGTLPFADADGVEMLVSKSRHEAPRARELVADVPADLDALCTDLLRRDPERRPNGRDVLQRLDERPSRASMLSFAQVAAEATFVGRRAELESLKKALDDAREGPVVALVHGESGVGKSALVRRFLENLPPEAVALAGRCYERESVPYKAVDGVIDGLSQFLVRELGAGRYVPPHAGILTQLFPVLRRAKASFPSSGEEGPVRDPQELRARAFAVLAELFSRLGRARPLVLSIDDLQWADGDSLALLEEILRGATAPPLLLVATVRERPSTEDWLGVDALAKRLPADVRALRVTSLGEGEAVELAAALIGGAGAPLEVSAEVLARESKGHPLFIAELVRHIRRFGSANAPALLDEAVWARVSRLEGTQREAMELLAVSGLPLEQAVLADVLGVDVAELRTHLDPLRADHLVRTGGPRPTDDVELYHDRVRDAVAGHVTQEGTRSHHRRLAEGLRAAGAEPERLARHWRGAGERHAAAGAYVAAAQKAEQALAFERAAEFYRAAIELEQPEGSERSRLFALAAGALANAGHGAASAGDYLIAAEDAPAEDARDLRLRAAEQLLRSGHLDEGLDLIGAILRELGIRIPTTPKRALASLLFERLRVRLRGLRFKERSAEDIDPSALRRIDACWSLALSFGHVDPIRGADLQAHHLLLALRTGEPYRVARSLGAEAIFVATNGRKARKRAAHLVEAASELSARVEHPHALGMAAMAQGLCAYFVGRWSDALDGCRRAIQIYREQCVGVGRELVTAQMFTLWSLSYLGRLGEMREYLNAWVHEAEARSDRYAATSMRLGFMNMVWLATDEPERAGEEVLLAMGPWSGEAGMQYMDQLIALGHIDLYRGEPEAAHQRIVKAWPALVRALLLTVQISRIELVHLRGRSVLAAVAADSGRDDARALIRRAAKDARTIQSEKLGWATALGELLSAGVAELRGDDGAAMSALTAAADGFSASDMGLYAAIADRLRGHRLGGDEGRKLVARADAWLAEQDVRDVGRMTAMLAPGLEPGG
jgi:eukaryotic-like serine/threonine-protein kinase